MKKDNFKGIHVIGTDLFLADIKPKSEWYHIWYNIKDLFRKKSEPIQIVFMDKGDNLKDIKKKYPEAWIFENPSEILAACIKMNKTFSQFINDALTEGLKLYKKEHKHER